jgi:hypothetical protein
LVFCKKSKDPSRPVVNLSKTSAFVFSACLPARILNPQKGATLVGLEADRSEDIMIQVPVHQKGGKPVTILRHSIYDLRNKNGGCFLKSFQEERKD